MDKTIDFFSLSILFFSRNLFILGYFNCHQPLWDSKGISVPVGREYSIGSSPLTYYLSMIPTPQPFSIASLAVTLLLTSSLLTSLLSCSREVPQNLSSNHLPILLTVPLSPVFRPNLRLRSFSFQKARWDNFAFYFDSHCPCAEECFSVSFSSPALITFLALSAVEFSISIPTLVFSVYQRSHFSVSQPNALRSRARGYLSKLRQAT